MANAKKRVAPLAIVVPSDPQDPVDPVASAKDLAVLSMSPMSQTTRIPKEIPPLQPPWKPSTLGKQKQFACRLVSVVLHPIVFCFFCIVLLLDVVFRGFYSGCRSNWSGCLRRDWVFDFLAFLSSSLMGFSLTFAMGAVGHYAAALKLANHFGFMLVVHFFAIIPWPSGKTNKMLVLARMNRVRYVARLTGLKCDSDDTFARAAAVDMWRAVEMRGRSELRKFELVQHYISRGADPNFPNEHGSTILHHFSAQVEVDYLKWLLRYEADPNARDIKGNTPLHIAASSPYGHGNTIMDALLQDPRTDPCIYNSSGKTPLMLRLRKRRPADSLKPTITWDTIENALARASAETCLAALAALVPQGRSPTVLRLPDLLFCSLGKETSLDELQRRRYQVWQLLLKPATMDVCTAKDLPKLHEATFLYAWEATGGSASLKEDARKMYREEMQEAFDGAIVCWATQAQNDHQRLNDHVETLEELKELLAIPKSDVQHGSFQRLPSWAITCDMCAAIKAFKCLRILCFAESLCDLLRCGRVTANAEELSTLNKCRYDVFTTRGSRTKVRKRSNPPNSPGSPTSSLGTAMSSPRSNGSRVSLSSSQSGLSSASTTSFRSVLDGDSTAGKRPKLFSPDTTVEFWMGLVTLWLVALHLYVRPSFVRRMEQLALPGEFIHGPVKDVEYVMTQSRKRVIDEDISAWGEKVLAPLWVINILSCTFEAKTAERAKVIEQTLAASFPVIKKENCYDVDGDCAFSGPYCHHKFTILFETSFTDIGLVSLLVEVRIVLVTDARMQAQLSLVSKVTSSLTQ